MKLLLNKFRSFNLPVDGIAILREMEGKNVLAVGERTIDINSCNFGYIRTSGIKRYRQGQRITACDFVNDVVEDLFLVLILDESKNAEGYLHAARQVLDSIKEVQITAIDINKESIQRAESIPASLGKLIRVSFTYTYQDVGDCETGICEYVADVECGIEPCESKSFCERVQECLPEGQPVFTEGCILGDGTEDNPIRLDEGCLPELECTLQVGSGCCYYVVEGIYSRQQINIDFPESITYGDISGNGSLDFFINGFPPNENIIYTDTDPPSPVTLTRQDLKDIFVAWGNSRSDINVSETTNGVTISLVNLPLTSILIQSIGGGSVNANLNLCSSFPVTCNLPQNQVGCGATQFGYTFQITQVFQVLINDEWTTIPDIQIVNGTWQRLNECTDIITEWRIIDSEENVIDSGDVTATCEGSSEETKPVCDWLQEHQTAIEELQSGGGGGGLTCETLANCQTIIDIETELGNKANTADLADVAFSGDYNDLINQPTIPAVPTNVSAFTNDAGYQTSAQVTAAIAAAKPITLVGIDATATALTGSVTNGVLGSILIPANTMTVGTIAEIEAFLRKVSPSAAPAHRLWINSANNLTGATQLALLTGANTTLSSKMERSFIVTNTGLTIFNSVQNSAIDDSAVAAAVTDVAVNWGVNQWLIHSANNATGETTTNIFLYMKKATP